MPRGEPEPLQERRQQRVEANPALMTRRQQIGEHPFGPLKPRHDQGYFLMKGREKVRAEFRVSPLADPRRRVPMLLGLP